MHDVKKTSWNILLAEKVDKDYELEDRRSALPSIFPIERNMDFVWRSSLVEQFSWQASCYFRKLLKDVEYYTR